MGSKRWILGAALAVAILGTADAQQTASLSGRVYDATDASVDDAQITLRNPASNAIRTVVSDPQGRFSFALLPAGDYNLQVEKEGFNKSERPDIDLTVGQTALTDVMIRPGDVHQTVTVSDKSALAGGA